LQEIGISQSILEIGTVIDHARDGDERAFGVLYDTYIDKIYRHVYYRTGSTEDAQDISQEVFIKAFKALPKYKKTNTPFIGWLMRISHNLIIDHYRKKKDHLPLDNELAFSDPNTNPENLAEIGSNQQTVRKAILKLPEDYQQVILMYFIEGFSYPEIAAAMGKKEGAIRVSICRALKKMRDILSKEKI
jgi:RNA polymerase sigma-70 factor, ECF subfamily